MTVGQLDEHIRSLRFNFCGHITIAELKTRLMPLLTKLMDSEYGWTFNNPVDPVQWNIPDYFDIIKCPMDLGTIKKRLENDHFNSVEAFAGDVRLVFENCIAYNSSTNKFNIAAKQLLASFNKSLAALKNQLEKQLFKRCEQRREEMCQLCGTPAPGGASVAVPFDGVLKKSSLVKRKNSEVAEEPWVECDSCKLWYHQICALFNERNHAISGEQEPFVCPICVKKQRAAGVKPSLDNGLKAKRLPITRMAKLIETRVLEAIEQAGKDEAVRMGNMGNSDSIGFSNESLSPNAGRVYVSYLDSVNYFQPKKLRTLMHQQVMLGFLEDCKDQNQKIPKSARLRQWYQKLLLQAKHDGLVVNISNLYAEYYMKKKAAHELPYFEGDYWPRLAEDLIKQLEEKDLGNRGKTGAAGTGDSVAAGARVDTAGVGVASGSNTPMNRSPLLSDASGHNEIGAAADGSDSKAPTSKKGSITPKASSKSKSKRSKQSALVPEPTVTRSSASKSRSKKGGKAERSGSNSKNVINNDPLMQKLKGILEPQKDDFFVVDLYPKCHKCEVAIVHEGYWELKTVPPPASVANLLDAAKKTRTSSSSSRNSPPRHYHYYYCSTCYDTNKTQLLHRVEVAGNCAKRARDLSERILPLNEKAAAAELAELDLQEIKFEAALKFVDPTKEVKKEPCVKVEGNVESANEPSEDTKTGTAEEKDKQGESDAKDSTDASAAIDASSDVAGDTAESKIAEESGPVAPVSTETPAASSTEEKQNEEKQESTENDKTTLSKETKTETKTETETKPETSAVKKVGHEELDDLIMPCEIFDTREAFLLYCQNNHCQFDQIRRAKHSSMMVLYHLFNQGTTGFTFSCSNCKTTLLSGNRWNCSICPVFNLCDACHTKTKHEHQLHSFKIVAIPRPDAEVTAESTKPIDAVSNGGSAATGRTIKREAGSSELKRTKHAKHAKGTGKKASGTRKRKLHQSSPITTPRSAPAIKPEVALAPTAAVGNAASAAATSTATAATATSSAAASTLNGDGTEGDAAKKRRIHNIDPQLLLQLEHASSCTVPNCAFFNCNRMQAMLKHGAVCEQRLAGPCVLCKRIIGLLSAHARQCTKDYASCKVPRCADIRRHFLVQVQARQQQLQRARQLQTKQQAASDAAAPAAVGAATATASSQETKDATS
ncbi:hypothetical protein BBJ29_003320 [Phytophthora kernoviae]|uniref:histone acetyltransferase n=1 Tax=Phytophthora kernoviae TaxID=325452 RepID=A0A3R7KIC3_9STRA|nr:hypothetical protein BBJ29_003320 [Phytophthora kernoviae]